MQKSCKVILLSSVRTARGKNVLRWAPDGQEMGGRWASDGEEIHFIEAMGKLFHLKFPLKTMQINMMVKTLPRKISGKNYPLKKLILTYQINSSPITPIQLKIFCEVFSRHCTLDHRKTCGFACESHAKFANPMQVHMYCGGQGCNGSKNTSQKETHHIILRN